jgi:hypothetical protein
MVTAIAERKMGRPKGSGKSGRKDRAVKVDAVVVGWAEMIAKARGITVAEYLSETLRKPVAKDFADVMAKMREGQD